MSYEIFYKRAFIRIPKEVSLAFIEDLYVPVLQHGSNNWFDVVFTRRGERQIPEKNWSNWKWNGEDHSGKIFCTPDQITAYGLVFGAPSTYGDLPHKSRMTCFKDQMEAMRWFCNGVKTARTVEQYTELGNTVQVRYWQEGRDEEDSRLIMQTVATTQELIDYVGYHSDKNLYVGFMGRELRLPKQAKSTHLQKEVDHFFVILFNGSYFHQLTARRLRYSDYESSAKRFLNTKLAQKVIDKIRSRFPVTQKYEFEIRRINRTVTL